jgi:uncharacterized protein (DUF1919 family)
MLALCKILMAFLDDVKRLAEECNVIIDIDDIEMGYRIQNSLQNVHRSPLVGLFLFQKAWQKNLQQLIHNKGWK